MLSIEYRKNKNGDIPCSWPVAFNYKKVWLTSLSPLLQGRTNLGTVLLAAHSNDVWGLVDVNGNKTRKIFYRS